MLSYCSKDKTDMESKNPKYYQSRNNALIKMCNIQL